MQRQTILERWGITGEELTEIVAANPSMRGLMVGYIAEYKLRKMFFESDPRIRNLTKYDDHDRARPGDLEFTYKGTLVRVEVKSLQTATIRREGSAYVGKFQCDASDRREVTLPNGESIVTTCLVAGEFDLLAVNLFEFEQEWRFVFARNQDLPRSRYRGYTPGQRRHLLATLVEVSFPPQPPFTGDPFRLLDEIVREQSHSSKTPRSSREPGSKSDSCARGPA
jgi:hypothetical protein